VPGYGRAHIMAPGKGIQFVLKNNKKIFLGTQKSSAFQSAVEKIMTVSQQV
jgi:ribosomal protein L24E